MHEWMNSLVYQCLCFVWSRPQASSNLRQQRTSNTRQAHRTADRPGSNALILLPGDSYRNGKLSFFCLLTFGVFSSLPNICMLHIWKECVKYSFVSFFFFFFLFKTWHIRGAAPRLLPVHEKSSKTHLRISINKDYMNQQQRGLTAQTCRKTHT